MTIDRDKARWLADFYQQVADGGQIQRYFSRWLDVEVTGPEMCSDLQRWRIKPREITVQEGGSCEVD